jgi:hypothetical protein
MRSSIFIASLLAALAAPGSTQNWKDDFNRPSGTQMGPDWIETVGDMAILNNKGKGNMPGGGHCKMVHVLAKGPYDQARMKITINPPSGSIVNYVGLFAGDGGANVIFAKVQDNDSDGKYDSIFYYNDDSFLTQWGTGGVGLTPFFRARVEMYFSNGGDTLNIDIDKNFDGVVDQHVENSGILAFAGQLSDGFAVGAYAETVFDDWEVDIPIPTGLTGTPSQLSLSAGGVQSLQLIAPSGLAGQTYLLLGTLSGTTPGIPVDSFVLPLNIDAYWLMTLTSPNQPPLGNSFGTLDSQGQTSITFTVPSSSNPAWAGAVFDHAAVVFDLTTVKASYVSNAVSATLVP